MKTKRLPRTRAKGARAKQNPVRARKKKNQEDVQSPIRKILTNTPVQRKIAVGDANDKYEKEADKVADKVVANQPVPNISGTSSGDGADRKTQEEEVNTKLRRMTEEEEAQTKLQRQEEEEEAQTKLQRQEEEEEAQTKLQRQEEEEEAQTKLQRQEEEEEAQTKLQRQEEEEEEAQTKLQRQEEEEEAQTKLQRQEEEEEAQTKLQRQEEEEEAQTKLQRQEEEEEAQTKLQRQEEEEEAQTKLQRQEEEEEAQTKLQRQEEEEEANPKLRRSATEEEEAQTQLRRMEAEEEEAQTKLMRKTAGILQAKGTPALSDEAERKIKQMRGHGQPLPKEVRKEMENKIGADFSSVQIHDNSMADELCKQINARAFTIGNDVFFASGEFAPTTEHGKKLLAHELAHVVQQQKGAKRQIRRAEAEAPNAEELEKRAKAKGASLTQNFLMHDTLGSIDLDTNEALIYKIELPSEAKKKAAHPESGDIPGGQRTIDNQTSVWDKEVRSGAKDAMKAKFNGVSPIIRDNKEVFYVKFKQMDRIWIDTKSSILGKSQLLRPDWASTGNANRFQVDHLREIQLGGDPAIGNLWMWDASSNGSSGSLIKSKLETKIKALIKLSKHVWKGHALESKIPTSPTGFKEQMKPFSYQGIGPTFAVSGSGKFWEAEKIKSGAHLSHIELLNGEDALKDPSITGTANKHKLYSGSAGGSAITIPVNKNNKKRTFNSPKWWGFAGAKQGLSIKRAEYDPATRTGSVELNLFKGGKLVNANPPTSTVPIAPIPGVEFGGGVQLSGAIKSKFTVRGLSPLEFDYVDIVPGVGIVADGRINASLPIFSGAVIPVKVRGGDVKVSFNLPSERLKNLSPFSITYSGVNIFTNGSRFGVEGAAGIKVDNVGEGEIALGMDNRSNVFFDGSFNFDSNLFSKAEAKVKYRNKKLSGSGDLEIAEGKIKGIKKAALSVQIAPDEFKLQGSVEPDIPAVDQANLNAEYKKGQGLLIGGELKLNDKTPGIKSGTINVQVKKTGSNYKVKATGTAEPTIPGIDSQLSVEYDDGAFTAMVEVAYERGLLSGKLKAGVTNRNVLKNGQLGDGQGDLKIFGGGEMTVKFTPTVQGTAGVEMSADGKVTVNGKIGIAKNISLLPRKEFSKNIISVSTTVPLGIPGLVGKISGNLDLNAGVGPVEIDKLELSGRYSPDDENATEIKGEGHISIPANASLRLGIDVGVGVGIPGASITGGIGIGGSLGVDAKAGVGATIEWSKAKGLSIKGKLEASAQPSFAFDIGGFVKVDTFIKTLYEKRWTFKKYQFGSNYKLGLELPIQYTEGKPFQISMSDIKVTKPDISANSVARSLVSSIV